MQGMNTLLVLIILFTCHENVISQPQNKCKPHIIFIIGDDIGWNDVGWNNERIYTPFMNKLAKEGVILDNHYTHPLCTPSRAALLTGYYADRLGLQRGVLRDTQPYGIPLKFTLLPEKMRALGYNTVAVGKWHLGFCSLKYTPVMRGFNTWLGFYTGAEENYNHCVNYYRPDLPDGSCVGFDFTDNLELAPQYTEEFSGTVFIQRIVDIINSYKDGDLHIFAYVSLSQSHFPVQAPSRFGENCKNSANSARELMCAAMASIDEGVQNITEALKKAGIYSNSLIIFVSDNGGAVSFGGNNYPLRGDKGSLYDGGSRAPAFVHSTFLKKTGYRNNKLIHLVDWFPTLLHVAGLEQEINSSLDGFNQWNVIEKNGESVRHSLPYQLDVTDDGIYMAAVRDDRYKFIAGPAGLSKQVPENMTIDQSYNYTFMNAFGGPNSSFFDLSDTKYKLFDLKDDPTETKNIADDNPKIVTRMKKLMFRYMRRSRPAMTVLKSASGEPERHNNTYVPGWCKPEYDVPEAIQKSNQTKVKKL